MHTPGENPHATTAASRFPTPYCPRPSRFGCGTRDEFRACAGATSSRLARRSNLTGGEQLHTLPTRATQRAVSVSASGPAGRLRAARSRVPPGCRTSARCCGWVRRRTRSQPVDVSAYTSHRVCNIQRQRRRRNRRTAAHDAGLPCDCEAATRPGHELRSDRPLRAAVRAAAGRRDSLCRYRDVRQRVVGWGRSQPQHLPRLARDLDHDQ